MIFQTHDADVHLVNPSDPKEIEQLVHVYNSHTLFIQTHLGKNGINRQWMTDEIHFMKEAGFWSCKVVNRASQDITGLIDFKPDIESYLSLLMIHQNFAHQGLGQQIYQALEDYLISSYETRCIRIDLVKDYSDRVMNFWIRNGFHLVDNIWLTWGTKSMPAMVMKKSL
ncbi:GNAT family N-acetyltransferase [Sulfobacillus thermosulfidooxidans]|uniref:GNAT family N-acetyltransferase n=1 Tax=Sulfobacillus thermosulfidooxidans TaxID=28034 RepID=UPI0006B448CD|nr:GNAT family N-acetyltransferase [Sulfobacillus thermosulfidooxidans]